MCCSESTQCVYVCCSVLLQCVAVSRTQQEEVGTFSFLKREAEDGELQCVAVCCSVF